MNYEEKYKEALERAKAGKPIDEVFPELKESEDERIRKELISYFEQFTNEELRGVNISDWIDWLKKPKEQKPTNSEKPKEWSEEEKEMLNSAIKFVEHCAFSTIGKGKNNVLAWLKSLRPKPQWKPSEEQINVLEYFIRSWGESGTMSPQNPTLCAAKTLLNDLKSL